MSNYAIDTAARFGEIPFVEFTKGLVVDVFDSLTETHISQMEHHANFINSLTQDLSTYINNTVDNVDFEDITDFILGFELPIVETSVLERIFTQLESPQDTPLPLPTSQTNPDVASGEDGKWWSALISALAPSVAALVDKIDDPSETIAQKGIVDYNNAVLNAGQITTSIIPTYKEIYTSIAALMASNKYSLLQTMAKQAMMRLVVTEGEIETKLTFSTWNSSTRGTESSNNLEDKVKTKAKKVIGGGIPLLFGKKKNKSKTKTITVNTAKSYQRDSSGTRVDIFGRVLIKFKTDYAPLNG